MWRYFGSPARAARRSRTPRNSAQFYWRNSVRCNSLTPHSRLLRYAFVTDGTRDIYALNVTGTLAKWGGSAKAPFKLKLKVGGPEFTERTKLAGLTSAPETPELYATEVSRRAVLKLTVPKPTAEVTCVELCTLEHEPAGVCLVSGGKLAVAAGHAVYLVPRAGGAPTCLR